MKIYKHIIFLFLIFQFMSCKEAFLLSPNYDDEFLDLNDDFYTLTSSCAASAELSFKNLASINTFTIKGADNSPLEGTTQIQYWQDIGTSFDASLNYKSDSGNIISCYFYDMYMETYYDSYNDCGIFSIFQTTDTEIKLNLQERRGPANSYLYGLDKKNITNIYGNIKENEWFHMMIDVEAIENNTGETIAAFEVFQVFEDYQPTLCEPKRNCTPRTQFAKYSIESISKVANDDGTIDLEFIFKIQKTTKEKYEENISISLNVTLEENLTGTITYPEKETVCNIIERTYEENDVKSCPEGFTEVQTNSLYCHWNDSGFCNTPHYVVTCASCPKVDNESYTGTDNEKNIYAYNKIIISKIEKFDESYKYKSILAEECFIGMQNSLTSSGYLEF